MESSPVSSSAAVDVLRAQESRQAAVAANERRVERQPEQRERVEPANETEAPRSNPQGQTIGRVINITV